MPEIPDVLPGETITTAWGNQTRDRTVQRYTNAADRNASNPVPVAGLFAWLDNEGVVTVYDGAAWRQLPYLSGTNVAMGDFFTGSAVGDNQPLTTIALPDFSGAAGKVVVNGVVGGLNGGEAGFAIAGSGVTTNIGDKVTIETNQFSAAWRLANIAVLGQTITIESNAPGVTCYYRGLAQVILL